MIYTKIIVISMYFTFPQFKRFPFKLFFRKSSENFLLNKLKNIFPNYNIIFTDSGRSAFQLAIESLDLKNSEMILPAYICDIFRPILKRFNIKPIHLDTNLESFHADFSDIESQITSNTKSILICHTYGLPIDMDYVLKLARNYNLKIIEDCAHIWPFKIQSDCAFFSFMKLFPITNGGMLILKNQINAELKDRKFKLINIIRSLRLFPKIANISERFRPEEKLKENQWTIPKKISKFSLKTVNYCLDNFNEQIEKKIELAKYFQDKLLKLRFEVQNGENNTFTYLSALVPENINRDKFFYALRKHRIFCSRIWQNPLLRQLPNTSIIADRIINFPLQYWYTREDINKIISYISRTMDSIS